MRNFAIISQSKTHVEQLFYKTSALRNPLQVVFITLRKRCLYLELFQSSFFPYFPGFGLNTRDTLYLSVFNPNAGEMLTRITPYTDTFYTVLFCQILSIDQFKGTVRYASFVWIFHFYFYFYFYFFDLCNVSIIDIRFRSQHGNYAFPQNLPQVVQAELQTLAQKR